MKKKDIIKQLNQNKIKLYEIEKYTDHNKAIEIRREYIADLINAKLDSLSKFPFSPKKIYGRNCENVIGGACLPIGIAGPMTVKGNHANGEYLIPLATTEGALVASVNRGSKIIRESGGATVTSKYVGITRAPLFRVKNIKEASKFEKWFKDNFKKIKKVGDQTDKYLTIKEYEFYSNGKNIWIRFVFDTGDAMGMNMAVIATKKICSWIETEYKGIKTIAISGNMCIDKKPAYINTIKGRGRIVEAEVTVPQNIVKKYLKSNPEDILEVNKNKIWLGGQMAGSFGFNAHAANMLAAIFIATGQDPAQVVGGSLASLNMEKNKEGLYIHTRIPSLNIATVGGGTTLATQNECQKIILSNISKNLKEKEEKEINLTQKLAEIIGTAVLAGEISLHAAFASRTFVKAHKDLGRCKLNKK
ncbi:3-hydroxy-3-methylglutaryl-CoA reductase [Candidatus Dojkabacteria bacterium]|nr:3-hydroxy-3-methylglutaryl-CoA reductase [Candidatus Dojkabacteria bacterium]